jgi:2-polyprenyl-3-methyl-5-hydroxy-6-metoxy-1,4-benzoquinol methylase
VTEPFYKRAAAESYAADDATGWFERVYAAAEAGEAVVPWDHHEPAPALVSWARACGLNGARRRALVVGCGLGDDAEFLAGLGFSVVAFDISATAIEAARRRWPGSPVAYEQADLFAAPPEWARGFDFVLEDATVQALPESVRPRAIRAIAEFVGPGGALLAIARARRDDEPARELPPFTLLRAELESFGDFGLTVVRLDLADELHWLGEYARV